MIGRIKWCVCCTLILVVQIAFSPVAEPASAPTDNSSATNLKVVQSTDREMLSPGESVSFDLTVLNTSKLAAVSNVRIMNMLPAGFKYKSGSAKLNSVSAAEPVVSGDGKSLIFKVGDLPQDGSATIRFVTEVTETSKPGKAVNYVSAISSGGGNSNVAMSTVLVRSGGVRAKGELPKTPVAVAEMPKAPASQKETLPPAPGKNSESAVNKNDPAVIKPKKPILPNTQVVSPPATVLPQQSAPPSPISSNVDGQRETTLKVTQNSDREMLAPGESVSFELTVVNTSKVAAASNVRIMDMLPAGFKFKRGSAQLNGNSTADPAVSDDGKALTFKVGDLTRNDSAKIRFVTEVSEVGKPGKAINYVSAISSGGGNSNVAMSTVLVKNADSRPKEEPPKTPVIVAETNIIPVTPKEASQPATKNISETTSPKVGADVISPPKEELPKTPLVVAETNTMPTAPKEILSPATEKTSETSSLKAGTNVIATQSVVPDVQVALPPVVSPPQPAPPEVPVKAEKPADTSLAKGLVVPEVRTLSELTGKSEIPVLSDADGQFVKSMTENQIIENEFAGQVGETSLLESIRAGRGFNRDSRAASARTEQAKAQTGQAVALLLPSVSVRGSYGSETSKPSVKIDPATGNTVASDTHSRTDASLTVRQPLFDLPSFMDWRRRKVVEQVRGENYRVSDGDAYLTTANAYLSLVSTRLQTDMTREFETQLTELLTYVEKRAKAGAASVSDMARVRARSQSTLSSRLEQESAHAAAGIEFVRLTNLVPRKIRLPELEDLGVSLLPKSFDMAVATAMKSNPEIAALKAEIQAAEIDKTSAKGRYLPKVDAEYTDSLSLHAGGDQSSAGQRDQRVMMVLNWNLFSGGSDYYNHVERAARHKELQYRMDDQRRRVVQTLSANYATLETTRERIASGYQELKSISTAADAMSKRMLSGNQSLLDLLDVYDRYYQIRSRLVSLHILEMSSVAQLVRLTHGAPGSDSIVK